MSLIPIINPNGVFTLDEAVSILQRGGVHLMDFAYKSFMQDGRGAVVFMFRDGRIDKLAYGARHAFNGSGIEAKLFPKIDDYLPARQCVVVVMWTTESGTVSRHFVVIPRDDA